MDTALRLHLAHLATARAHLAGASPGPAARRRYWRELACAATLSGWPWPDAERLGQELPPPPPQAASDATKLAYLRTLLDANPDASPGDLLANLPA